MVLFVYTLIVNIFMKIVCLLLLLVIFNYANSQYGNSCSSYIVQKCKKNIYSVHKYCDMMNIKDFENDININKCGSQASNTLKICAFKYYPNERIVNLRAFLGNQTCFSIFDINYYWYREIGHNVTITGSTIPTLKLIRDECRFVLNQPLISNVPSRCPGYVAQSKCINLPTDYSYYISY